MLVDSLLSPEAARRVNAAPRLRDFAGRAAELLSSGGELAGLLPDFEDLVRSGFLRDVLHHELERVAREPLYSPGSSERRLGLVSCPLFDLSVLLLEGPPSQAPGPRIRDSVEHRLLGAAGPGALVLEHFHQPAPHPHDVIDRSRRLVARGLLRLEPGTCLALRALEDVTEPRPTGEPALAVVLASRRVTGIAWEYERASLQPLRMVAADLGAARLEQTAALLAALGDAGSVPVLLGLLEHESHSVRWAAIRAVMQLDTGQGFAALRRAESDPHPHVRNAARRALEKLTPPARSPHGPDPSDDDPERTPPG